MDLTFLYWIDVLSNLKDALYVVSLISLTICIILGCTFLALYEYCTRTMSQNARMVQKWLRRSLCVFIICLTIMVFIPSKATMHAMAISRNSMVENLNN